MILRKRKVEPTPKVVDRRATDLLRNAMVAEVIVDDPFSPGEKIATVRSIRDDILASMLARHEIDQAQYDAGRDYQRYAENASIGDVKAMDPAKEKVDGGQIGGSDLSNRQINAVRKLQDARRALTDSGDDLVRAILVRRAAFSKLAQTERDATRLKARFFYALEILASLWGKTNIRRSAIPLPPGGS